jgi:protein dithiol:quinone oxidoreductase
LLHFIAASVGAGIAARHVWIQSHPDQVMAECGVGFDYMFESFPFKRAIELVFKGTGECTKIDWTFLGLTIPQLSFIGFATLAAYAVLLTLRKRS